jgi:predicted ATPase
VSRQSAPADAHIFRHALIQEAAYQSLLLARRRQYHQDVGRALEAMETDDVEPEIIAQHYTAAGLPEQAVPQLAAGGKACLGAICRVRSRRAF